MNSSTYRWLGGAVRASPVLAGLTLASCATQPLPAQQPVISNPTVTLQYRNDKELIQANQRAAIFCDQYLSIPRAASISDGPDRSRIVAFECASTKLSPAQPGQFNPNFAYNYHTDQELLDASRNAQIYCRSNGSRQVTVNIVSNRNGTKTISFGCVPRQRADQPATGSRQDERFQRPNSFDEASHRGEASHRTTGSFYRVQPGDTLTGLAADFGVPASAILDVNPGLGYNGQLEVHQLINVPNAAYLQARRKRPLPARVRNLVEQTTSGYGGHKIGENLSIEGVVTPEGKECPAIRDASGKLYALTTSTDVLHPGDVVTVQGRVAPADWCHQGISIAVTSLHYRPHWGSSDRSDSSNDRRSDIGDSDRNRSSDERATNDSSWPRLETVAGIVTHEASDCVTVRADNGTLYSVPARQAHLTVGQKVELKGKRSAQQTCRRGITFDVQEVRRR